MRAVLAQVLLVLGCLLSAGVPALAGDERPLSPEAFDQAIARLRHPMLAEREAARRDLLAAMPGVRERVIGALEDAPWVVRLQLAHVLATDASKAATDALLGLFEVVDDVEADAIRMRVLSDEAASKRLLDRFQKDPALLKGKGRGKDRLRALHDLLHRAEIEETFLARKSDSGSTGYYRGQYDALKPMGRAALDVVTHIALDEALPVPGRYTTGHYQFIRMRPIELWEIRDMAINAVAELARPTDRDIIEKLERYGKRLEIKAYTQARRIRLGGWSDDEDELEDQEVLMEYVGQWGDVLSALYIIDRTTARESVLREYMSALEYDFDPKIRFSWWSEGARAATAIRVGWYPEAITLYGALLRRRYGPSPATSYYNLACAYASWSLDPGDHDAEQLRDAALSNLSRAVYSGWTDLGWMEEDRDLDPIRDTPTYRELVTHIRKELGVTRRGDDRDK